jgi:hypothetical protein
MNIVLRIAFIIIVIGSLVGLVFASHYLQWFQLPFLAGITTQQSFVLMLVSLEITILAFGAAAVIYLWQKFSTKKND